MVYKCLTSVTWISFSSRCVFVFIYTGQFFIGMEWEWRNNNGTHFIWNIFYFSLINTLWLFRTYNIHNKNTILTNPSSTIVKHVTHLQLYIIYTRETGEKSKGKKLSKAESLAFHTNLLRLGLLKRFMYKNMKIFMTNVTNLMLYPTPSSNKI